jgi:hypothetical protein
MVQTRIPTAKAAATFWAGGMSRAAAHGAERRYLEHASGVLRHAGDPRVSWAGARGSWLHHEGRPRREG